MKIGYARVSTTEQNLDAQLSQLDDCGVEKVFSESESGSTASNRTQLNAMIDFARCGDVIYITKVDRVARNTIDALQIADALKAKNVGIVFLDLGDIDINSDVGRVIYTTMSCFAEMERKRILQRCNEGRKIAKAKGIVLGRSKDTALRSDIEKLLADGVNKTQIAKRLGCSRQMVYKVVNGQ
jgi:DNA invertase Pin-like site-specific DNA recombinase